MLGMLDKPGVFGSHIDRARGMGSQGLRDYVAEKALISLCWVCVGVLEVRLVLVYVSLALQ